MKRRVATACAVGIALWVLASGTAAAAEPGDPAKAFMKLTRGFMNIVTGWVEVPKRIHETAESSGGAAGFTWGLLRGIGHGFVRTASGFYEFFTFPFPAPPGYESVIQPEYVFDVEPASGYSK